MCSKKYTLNKDTPKDSEIRIVGSMGMVYLAEPWMTKEYWLPSYPDNSKEQSNLSSFDSEHIGDHAIEEQNKEPIASFYAKEDKSSFPCLTCELQDKDGCPIENEESTFYDFANCKKHKNKYSYKNLPPYDPVEAQKGIEDAIKEEQDHLMPYKVKVEMNDPVIIDTIRQPETTDLYSRITKNAKEISELVIEKNKAYGSSFKQANKIIDVLYPNGVKPEQYSDMLLITRVIDKLFRIANKKDAFGENPWKDIMGYALLAVSDTEE